MDNLPGFRDPTSYGGDTQSQPQAPQLPGTRDPSAYNASSQSLPGQRDPLAYSQPQDRTQSNSVPIDVRNAQEVTGQHDLDGLCETAVEQWSGLPKMGTTAGNAWSNWASQGKAYTGLQGAQPGDLLYFQPNGSNQGAGHAALFEGYDNQGNPLMISATDQGVREDNVSHWSSTIAPLLGYVHPQ